MSELIWNEEQLFDDGDAYYRDLLSGINSAQKSIDFESYIFTTGKIGTQFSQALKQAAGRGVVVRLLIDGVGSPDFMAELGRDLSEAGIQVRMFHSLPWSLDQFRGESPHWFNRFFHRLSKINRRNHRKVCVIDGQTAWVGSFNITDIHSKECSGENAWHDIGVRIQGQEIGELQRAFSVAFRSRRSKINPVPFPQLILQNDSLRRRIKAGKRLMKQILDAKERIWIQNPYFVPVKPVFKSLVKKAEDGIDVRIILPEQNDIFFVRLMSYAFFNRLLVAGAKIFEYQPTFLHEKILQIDDRVIIGSTNFNHRSIIHDLEVEVVLSASEGKKFLEEKFKKEELESREIQLADWRNRSVWRRMVSRIFMFFRYWC